MDEEVKVKTKGKTALPADFSVTDDMKSWAKINSPGIDVYGTTQEFIDYSRGRDWRMADWTATWRNWMRKASKAAKGRNTYAGAERVAEAKPAVRTQEDWPQPCQWRAAANRVLFAVLQASLAPAHRLPELIRMKNQMGDRLRNLYGDGPCPAEDWRKISHQSFEWMLKAANGSPRKTRGGESAESEGEPSELAA